MYKSISYLEISCKYNRSELCRFCGALQNASAYRVFKYRGRKYYIVYLPLQDEFRILNARDGLVAVVVGEVFKFYASSTPEIGLDLIFAFMALLNIYPVKAY